MTTNLLAIIDTSSIPALVILAECFVLLFVGKMIFDITTPQFRGARQLGSEKNAALGVTLAMYYLGLASVVSGVAGEGSLGIGGYEEPLAVTVSADASLAPASAPAAWVSSTSSRGWPGRPLIVGYCSRTE